MKLSVFFLLLAAVCYFVEMLEVALNPHAPVTVSLAFVLLLCVSSLLIGMKVGSSHQKDIEIFERKQAFLGSAWILIGLGLTSLVLSVTKTALPSDMTAITSAVFIGFGTFLMSRAFPKKTTT